MTARRRATLCLLLLAGLTTQFSSQANAGAWTQAPGHWQVITTADYYRSTSRFDNSGNLRHQSAYTKYELNPYVEYGLRDGLTVGANLFLQHLSNSSNTTNGLGDTEIFLRQRLYDDGRYTFALQPEIKLPSPESYGSHNPSIGSQHVDAGLRALGGMNYSLLGRKHYADVEAAYRHRTGSAHDQFFLSATTGLSLTGQITLMPQLFQTLRAQGSSSASFSQSPRDDYNLTRAQVSLLYSLGGGQSLQLGAFNDVAGRNAGRGTGILLAFWKDF